MWNLSCRKTRHRLALLAGNDLEERDLPETQRHLAVCPRCREVWQSLRHSQEALEGVISAPAEDQGQAAVAGTYSEGMRGPEASASRGSVWPAVARHIVVIDEQAAATSWRGWLPAAALAAACLAIVMVAIPESPFGSNVADKRRPAVIVPSHASQATDLRSFPVTVLPDADRDAREAGRERLLPRFEAVDEPRSF
jgi:hypothetical protein